MVRIVDQAHAETLDVSVIQGRLGCHRRAAPFQFRARLRRLWPGVVEVRRGEVVVEQALEFLHAGVPGIGGQVTLHGRDRLQAPARTGQLRIADLAAQLGVQRQGELPIWASTASRCGLSAP